MQCVEHYIHYYEIHITIEPVFDERLAEFKKIIEPFGFRAAELLMKKRKHDTPTKHAEDTFCTGRKMTFEDAYNSMEQCFINLVEAGFKVYKKKIEAVIFDERLKQDE